MRTASPRAWPPRARRALDTLASRLQTIASPTRMGLLDDTYGPPRADRRLDRRRAHGCRDGRRLGRAGVDLTVWNRTRAKAEPLADAGAQGRRRARRAARPRRRLHHGAGAGRPRAGASARAACSPTPTTCRGIVVDCSTVVDRGLGGDARGRAPSAASTSSPRRSAATARSCAAGKLTLVVSGPEETYDEVAAAARATSARRVTYVGEGDVARLVKICHNMMLGVVTQSMAEITVLAEKGGVPRAAFLDFLNNSVMGSVFTPYKSPAFVNLDYTPTFTPVLLRKDFDLGLRARRTSSTSRCRSRPPPAQPVQATRRAAAGSTRTSRSCSTCRPRNSGLELEAEDVEVDDGLAPLEEELTRWPGRPLAGARAHGRRLRAAGRLRPAARLPARPGQGSRWRPASAAPSCCSTSTTSATRRRPGSAAPSATR